MFTIAAVVVAVIAILIVVVKGKQHRAQAQINRYVAYRVKHL